MIENTTKTVADFFAGIGLVSYGLAKRGWTTLYAVDYSQEKRDMYEGHFGQGHYHVQDVANVAGKDVPNVALAHASFPCTDMSVAGGRLGFAGIQSASLWNFARIISEMAERKPPILLLENVEGLLTSDGGCDLHTTLSVLNDIGYAVDIVLINAAHFVPQSRMRMFIIGKLGYNSQSADEIDAVLSQQTSARPAKLQNFIRANEKIHWHLKALPELPIRTAFLSQILDLQEQWWTQKRTAYLVGQMPDRHKLWVKEHTDKSTYLYGTAFRRMRKHNGVSKSTAELRVDGVAGCLRTPKGGSAKQILVRVGHGSVDARLLNSIECARLMGAPDYKLGKTTTLHQALFGFGDAVCADVVSWLAEHYLDELMDNQSMKGKYINGYQAGTEKLLELLDKYNEKVISFKEKKSLIINIPSSSL